MHVLRSKKFLILLAGLIGAGITAAVAIPGVIFSQTTVDTTAIHFRVDKRTVDAGGFDSGWHVHPGLAIVQVQQGSFQIYQGSCTPRTLNAGDTYIEIPYEPVRGVATGGTRWTTTFIVNGPDPILIPWSAYSGGQPNPCP